VKKKLSKNHKKWAKSQGHIVTRPQPDFVLERCTADDPSLPRPRSTVGQVNRPVNVHEALKLAETKKFGGLLPERSAFLDSLCSKIGPLPKNGSKEGPLRGEYKNPKNAVKNLWQK
jgi:hypothetical protein